MGRLARRNISRAVVSKPVRGGSNKISSTRTADIQPGIDYTKSNLTRGLAQFLPYPEESFETVVATFPAEYIFQSVTLEEAYRVLVPGGRLVILPGASILGRGLMDRLMAFIFHLTGQTSPNLSEVLHEKTRDPFAQAKFHVEFHELEIRSSRVFILVATKPSS
jgi:ubiquinone/menaquinone biosynthesis C-methylase UbiE